MKKFIFGLIMMLFAFSTLPVQANAPDDGVKKEIIKSKVFDFTQAAELTFEVPQIQFNDYSIYRLSEHWNYNNTISLNEFYFSNKHKMQLKKWRLIKYDYSIFYNSFLKNKLLHVDPGSFSF